MSYALDLSRLPNIPWTVWPEAKGTTAIIKDACNEKVAEIRAFTTREDLLEIARLIEDATRSR